MQNIILITKFNYESTNLRTMKKISILFITLFAFISLNAQQAGSLDPDFGDQGILQYQVSSSYDMIYDIEIQPDGKILAIGRARVDGSSYYVAICRHLEDGTLDASFGNNGIRTFQPTMNYGNFIMDGKVLDDGKIILGGYVYDGGSFVVPLIIKLNSDGSNDTSFGENGISVGAFGDITTIEAVDIQSDGKIVLAGYINDKLSAIRYTADGQLDTSFGTDGRFIISIPDVFLSFAKDMVIQPDGKIVIAGMDVAESGNYQCLAVRLNENGTLDETFANNGMAIVFEGDGHNFINAVALQSDGKILLGGHTWVANIPQLQYDFMVVRLNADGTIDNSYGTNGFAKARCVEGGENYILDMVLAEDGIVYATGYTTDFDGNDIAVVSFTPDGIINTGFGTTGMIQLDINQSEEAESIAIQQNGRIIIGGYLHTNNASEFLMARYFTNSTIGIDESNEDENLTVIYPNPAENFIVIDNILDNNNYKANIYNINGQILMSTTVNAGTVINVSNLASGYYIIKLTSETKSFVNHFIKK